MYQELVATQLRDLSRGASTGVFSSIREITDIFNREQLIGEVNGLNKLEELVQQEATRLNKKDNGINDTEPDHGRPADA